MNITAFSHEALSKTDSLLTSLESAKGIDKIDIYIELSEENLFSEKGYKYAQNALELANKLNNQKHKANSLYALGRFYYVNRMEEDALKHFFKALEIYSSTNDKKALSKTNRAIGKCYFYLNSIEEANKHTQQSIELADANNFKTEKAKALIDLGDLLAKKHQYTEAINKVLEALKILQEHGTKKDLYLAYNALGGLYFDHGEYQSSIEAYLKEIEIKEQLNDTRGVAISRHNLGNTHRVIGNYQTALEQYQKSLTLSESIDFIRLIAANNREIGMVYESLSRTLLSIEENRANYRRALSFHEDALKAYQALEDKEGIAQSLNNIANTYSHIATTEFVEQYGEFWEDSLYQISSNVITSTFGKTFENYNKALEIFEELDETNEIIKININLGAHYIHVRDWNTVTQHLNKALRLARKTNNQYDIALTLYYFGEYFYRTGNLQNAEQNLQQSLHIAEELGTKDLKRHVNQRLAHVYEKAGNLSMALKHTKNYNKIKDEIFSEQSQKIITEMQTKYETEKKEQEIKLLNNERALNQSIIQRQRLTLAITIGGLIVILAFAILLINMIRQKQRANRILEEKNELISNQKQEITDSIRYASRIQNAILPSTNLLNESLKDHFVLFIPRDIVSGDFYWFTKQQDKMIIVAADCTGHGVPGAFMSMLGVSFLYEIVNKEGVMQPARILDMLRDFIKLTLSQTGKKDEQKDGMDISLCMLDHDNMKLEWAGAYNPLVLIRNNEIIEYRADKMPVAIHITDHKSFTNHQINLQPNDVFYMYSDGFPDQFGGDQGRKFMSKRFKQLLLDIHQKPMNEQKEILRNEHIQWRGDNYEQIDDIVVFGVKV
ncbi:MAG: tetratricopeptide repeat protein [Bacteroidales bacterium]